MEVNTLYVAGGAGAIVLCYLATQSWFWIIASGLGAIASVFAALASIVHFQILGALGFVLLTIICIGICNAAGTSFSLPAYSPPKKEIKRREPPTREKLATNATRPWYKREVPWWGQLLAGMCWIVGLAYLSS